MKQVKEVPITSEEAFDHFAQLYLRYIQIMRKLEDCYDQIVHPQKRRDVKVALDIVMARICQIKAELYKFGADGRRIDYVNLDKLLPTVNLSPHEAEIIVPRCVYFCVSVTMAMACDRQHWSSTAFCLELASVPLLSVSVSVSVSVSSSVSVCLSLCKSQLINCFSRSSALLRTDISENEIW